MRKAVGDLLGSRLVAWRGASDGRGNEDVTQPQPVVDAMGGRDIRETGAMQRRHQKVAGSSDAIAGEDPPGTVGAVGRRCETDEHETGLRIAESRNRLTPIDVVPKGAAPGPGDLGAVGPQSRAPLAGDDALAHDAQRNRSWFVVRRASCGVPRSWFGVHDPLTAELRTT